MTFNEVLSQTIAMLQQHGRVSYRALKRQFAIDDAFLEDLKYELIEVQQRAVDQDCTMLVWTGETDAAAAPMSAPATSATVPPSAAYRQALAQAEELGMCPLQAHSHHGLGPLYATAGQRAQARAALSTAIELYRAMDMTFWLPQTEAALARVC